MEAQFYSDKLQQARLEYELKFYKKDKSQERFACCCC